MFVTSVQPSVSGIGSQPQDVHQIDGVKESGRWRVTITSYLPLQNRSVLHEISGVADELLAWVARRRKCLHLLMSCKPFEGALMLELEKHCADGGAYYRLISQRQVKRFFICDISLLIFGDLPVRIFFSVNKTF